MTPPTISLAKNPELRLIETRLSKLRDPICEGLERIFSGALGPKFRAILKLRRAFYPFKAAAKRRRSGKVVHDFRGLHGQLGTLTMNRIEPSGPGKPRFDVPSSPTRIQDQARLLNAKVPMR